MSRYVQQLPFVLMFLLPELNFSHRLLLFFTQTLDLSYCPKLTSKAVLELIPLEKLQHLNLQGTKVLGSDMIEYLEKSTSNSSLETLNLSAVRKEDSGLIGDACVQAIAVSL